MNVSSYTSASTFPAKILNPDIIYDAISHSIKPYHIQLNPTNKCPLNCSFCSCKNRGDEEMPFEQAHEIINFFQNAGTKACTITGGGDPLAYPDINMLINYLNLHGMSAGLVTNGVLIDNLDTRSYLKWIRVSTSMHNKISGKAQDMLKKIKDYHQTDISSSYVIHDGNLSNLIETVEIANKLNFSHVRVVDDILDDGCSHMDEATHLLAEAHIDDSRVIYQGRKGYTKGSLKCLISLLKPNIGPSGNVYPCCGIQYSLKTPSLTFDDQLSMGKDYKSIWSNQEYFDGSVCSKCFYSGYNDLLNVAWDSAELSHKEFV
jgi:MoaA/NifB/PqqE/SkfB family radical SAM enzyme